LPFDRLRASGGVLKSFDFSVHAELVEASNTIWATARLFLNIYHGIIHKKVGPVNIPSHMGDSARLL
jgi:hypothetical protein